MQKIAYWQNMFGITYCIVVRGGLSHGQRNRHRKFGELFTIKSIAAINLSPDRKKQNIVEHSTELWTIT